MKKMILTFGLLAFLTSGMKAQYDDIYYNPKKAKTQQQKRQQKQSYYIEDFSNVDVDEYNRRGEMYYQTPVDTIGARVETDEDFVYTQKIQKYYNPTIVLDNVSLLGDVLNNSYGNVEVVINNNGYPVFAPYYNYRPFYYDYAWGPSWSWSWNWNWGPVSWRWNWGPSWGYNYWYGPGWGWSPAWAWGPAWGWNHSWNHPHYAYYPNRNPNAARPSAPRPGWGSHQRPGYNYAGNAVGRPGGNRTPAMSGSSTSTQPVYSGNRRGYNKADVNTNSTNTNRGSVSNRGTYTNNSSATNSNKSSTTGTSSGNRRSYGTSTSTQRNSSTRSTATQRSNNTNQRSSGYSTPSRSSYGGSSSRSYGGGSHSGGGGGGGHRR